MQFLKVESITDAMTKSVSQSDIIWVTTMPIFLEMRIIIFDVNGVPDATARVEIMAWRGLHKASRGFARGIVRPEPSFISSSSDPILFHSKH
ncbi:hypothetical protein IEQ34_001858 [Dendrobium chrysotoxum]|uniref:Uncharacterized protein n=1 Tax=Dendrobium chrysotoxum TaxID=161865 RepID=A0AAV7HI81_DENCH|nr:hypothetical protein IEQ34_001858 [Dendrobium chrysotoxum]